MDIEQPLAIKDDQIRQLLAYMWMSSKTSCIPKPTSTGGETVKVGRDPEFEAIIDRNASGAGFTTRKSITTRTKSRQISARAQRLSKASSGSTDPTNTIVTESQDLPGTGFCVNIDSTRWAMTISNYSDLPPDGLGPITVDSRTNSSTHYLPAVFNLTPLDVQRWRLAREAMDQYELEKPHTNLDLVTIKPIPETTDLEEDDSAKHINIWALLGLTFLAVGYGGLHALAWNAHFPTHRELILWRISVLVIAIPAALLLLFVFGYYTILLVLNLFLSCHHKFNPRSMHTRTTTSRMNQSTSEGDTTSQISTKIGDGSFAIEALGPLIVLLWILYLLARAFLVYESFRTVFCLPPEAYEATKWTQYLPHIT